MFDRIKAVVFGAFVAVAVVLFSLREAFKRGAALQEARYMRAAQAARQEADAAARAYEREGGAVPRLLRGDF